MSGEVLAGFEYGGGEGNGLFTRLKAHDLILYVERRYITFGDVFPIHRHVEIIWSRRYPDEADPQATQKLHLDRNKPGWDLRTTPPVYLECPGLLVVSCKPCPALDEHLEQGNRNQPIAREAGGARDGCETCLG